MTHARNDRPVHWAARMYAREHTSGDLSRREFLARATAMGVTAPMAYGLIGAAQPVQAAGHASSGGTMRVQMSVRGLTDTRSYDWPELGNQTRGNLEYLVEYNNDGTFRGMLLDGWDVSDDATRYTLNIRPGVTWDNGEAFTAEHVAFNVARWCERDVPGNSMAGRMATLIDDTTNRALDGAITVVDDTTLRLTLPRPDISIIAGMADYPAAIVHPSYDPEDTQNAIGTGPYRIVELDIGVKCTLQRKDRDWWGTEVFVGPYLDRIEYVDYGTDPATWLAAIEAEDVHFLHESVGDFIEVMDTLGLAKSEVVTGATIVVRPNQLADVGGMSPYADLRVRRALALAVDNAICLELGYGNRGIPAENHHVAPFHPEYAELPPLVYDPDAARALIEEAEMLEFEHELVSLDDDWQTNTADAVAAQLRDAGLMVRRVVQPGASYWQNWNKYPFSATAWNHRPLGVQNHALAYRSGGAWNEFGWANPEFDALLAEALAIADADKRREVMRQMQLLIQEDGVTIQPYWRSLYRHLQQGIVGADQHISYEHHHYKWGFSV